MDEEEDVEPILKVDSRKSASRTVPPGVEDEEKPILPSPNQTRSRTISPNTTARRSRDMAPGSGKRTRLSNDGGLAKRMRMDRRVVSLFYERSFCDVMMDELVSDDIELEAGDTTVMLMAKLKSAQLNVQFDGRLFETRDESICVLKYDDELFTPDKNLDAIPTSAKLYLSFEVRLKFVSLDENHFIHLNVDIQSPVIKLKGLVAGFAGIPAGRIKLVFGDGVGMDDSKVLGDYKDFLRDCDGGCIWYSRVQQMARKSVGVERSDRRNGDGDAREGVKLFMDGVFPDAAGDGASSNRGSSAKVSLGSGGEKKDVVNLMESDDGGEELVEVDGVIDLC
jgi:hypothetical protein